MNNDIIWPRLPESVGHLALTAPSAIAPGSLEVLPQKEHHGKPQAPDLMPLDVIGLPEHWIPIRMSATRAGMPWGTSTAQPDARCQLQFFGVVRQLLLFTNLMQHCMGVHKQVPFSPKHCRQTKPLGQVPSFVPTQPVPTSARREDLDELELQS